MTWYCGAMDTYKANSVVPSGGLVSTSRLDSTCDVSFQHTMVIQSIG